MKKKILSAICAAAVLLSLLSFSGCHEKKNKIAFFMYDGTDTFISEMMDYMTSNVPFEADVEVRDAGNSQAVQNQQIVELISDGFDLFVINAVDRLACSSIVEKCSKADIPVIFFNREPLEDALDEEGAFYVGAAADSLGEKQADMVAELFTADFAGSQYDRNADGVIQTIILKGQQGHQDAEKRTENCVNRLKALGFKVEVLALEVANWSRKEAFDATAGLFPVYGGEIELIFANNDDMALGAIDYLKRVGVFSTRTGFVQPFIVVGVDGTKVGLESIDNGLLYGTVNNDAFKQSDAIITLAEYLIDGKSLESFPYEIINGHYIYVDGDIITRANLDKFTTR